MYGYCETCGHDIAPSDNDSRRMEQWILRRLRAAPSGLTRRELTNACSSRDRGRMRDALAHLISQDMVIPRGSLLSIALR